MFIHTGCLDYIAYGMDNSIGGKDIIFLHIGSCSAGLLRIGNNLEMFLTFPAPSELLERLTWTILSLKTWVAISSPPTVGCCSQLMPWEKHWITLKVQFFSGHNMFLFIVICLSVHTIEFICQSIF